MLRLIIRRMLVAIPMLLVCSVLVFILVANAGDPLEALRGRPNSQQAIAQRTATLHLNEPIFQRYWLWFSKMLHGDFGIDNKGLRIGPQLWRAMGTTLQIVLLSTIIAVCLGIAVGVISAVRQYSFFDYSATFVSFLFYAMPVFWFAVLLKVFGAIEFNNWLENPGIGTAGFLLIGLLGAGFTSMLFGFKRTVTKRRRLIAGAAGFVGTIVVCFLVDRFLADRTYFRWIGTVNTTDPRFARQGFWPRLGDHLGHLVLPVTTLAVISYAGYSRFTRASMLETLSADYVRTARAKGVSERTVIFKHAFRTALIPIVTVVALDFGAIFGGAIITETVFSIQGMGKLFREALQKDIDPNKAMAYLIVTAINVVIFNLIADIIYAKLDPRIRHE